MVMIIIIIIIEGVIDNNTTPNHTNGDGGGELGKVFVCVAPGILIRLCVCACEQQALLLRSVREWWIDE